MKTQSWITPEGDCSNCGAHLQAVSCGVCGQTAHDENADHDFKREIRTAPESSEPVAVCTCVFHLGNLLGEMCGACKAARAAVPPDALTSALARVAELELVRTKLLSGWGVEFVAHSKHIQRWLTEMYQVMVDPLEDFKGNIEELCALLLKRATEDRQALYDRLSEQVEQPVMFTDEEIHLALVTIHNASFEPDKGDLYRPLAYKLVKERADRERRKRDKACRAAHKPVTP